MAITPYLYYRDLEAALAFLSAAFGFREYGPSMKGADGKLSHASMKLGDDLVMMGRPGGKYRNPKQLKQATQSLYVEVCDVDKLFKRVKKAGAEILEEPVDTAYGHRRFGAVDPEGHQWYFAQAIEKPARKKSDATKTKR